MKSFRVQAPEYLAGEHEVVLSWSKDGVEFLEVWKGPDGHPHFMYRNTDTGNCCEIVADEKERFEQALHSVLKDWEEMAHLHQPVADKS